MASHSTTPFAVRPDLFKRGGLVAMLLLAVAASVVTMLGAITMSPSMLLAPALAVTCIAALVLVRRPLLHLCTVLALSVSIISYQEGIQWYEALYGLYFFVYIGGWFFYRGMLRGDTIVRDAMDASLLLLLVFATLTFAMTVLHGGDLGLGFREWISLVLLGFLFPIRRAIEEDPRALKWIAVTLVVVAAFVLFRNILWYLQGLQRAEYLWQIATGRVRMNENFLMVAAIGFVSMFAYARGLLAKTVAIGIAALFSAGVIIGQSRAVWVSLFLGFCVVFFAVGRRQKIQLALLGSISVALIGVLGAVLLDDFFEIVVVGLLDRITSLGTAVVTDISLVNRFVEWSHVAPLVLENPLFGHGFGTSFQFFDIIYKITDTKSHIHNTYLSFLYHHGLIGLGLLLFFAGSVVRRSLSVLRTVALDRTERAILVGALSSLAALGLAAMTESLLTVNDGVLVIMFSLSVCMGIAGRYGGAHGQPS